MDPVHQLTSGERAEDDDDDDDDDYEESDRCQQEEGENSQLSVTQGTTGCQGGELPLACGRNRELSRNDDDVLPGTDKEMFSAASGESGQNQMVSVSGAGEEGHRVQIPLENVTSRTGKTVNVYNVMGNTGVKIVQTQNEGHQKASSTNIHIIDQSKLRLTSDFNSRLFIKTSTIDKCEQKLLQRGMVTITGQSGEGKTLASIYLLKTLSEKESRQPMILTDPSQWDHIPTHQQSKKPSKYTSTH